MLANLVCQGKMAPNTMKKTKPAKPPSEEYQRFEALAKMIIAVPKSELDKREAEYQK
jgi:hypothetical protein